MPEIVYEDNHLIVAVKPAGLLTQGDVTGDDCLLDQLKRYIKELDPDAFFIVCDASEVLGEGFGEYDPQGL